MFRVLSMYSKGKRLSGMIYLDRIVELKMSGSAVKNLEIFQRLCGRDAFPNIVLVSTLWEELRGKR